MYHRRTFFRLGVGVRCRTGSRTLSPLLSPRDCNSDERERKNNNKKILQSWNVLPGHCGQPRESGRGGCCACCCWRCCHRANPTCAVRSGESDGVKGIRKLWGDLEVSGGNLYVPFLDRVPRKYLPWKDATERVAHRADRLHMLSVTRICGRTRAWSHSESWDPSPLNFLWLTAKLRICVLGILDTECKSQSERTSLYAGFKKCLKNYMHLLCGQFLQRCY